VDCESAVCTYQRAGVTVHAVRERAVLRSWLRQRIQSLAPDVVLVSSEDQSQQLLDVVMRDARARVVYIALTPQLLPFGPESLHPGAARTALVRKVPAILSISQIVADYVRHHLGRDAFVTMPPIFEPGPWRRCGSFDSGTVLMLNACTVKGLPIFLALAQRLPQYRFVAVAGYGTTSDDLDRLARLPNVAIKPNQRSLDDLLSETAVLLMPSLWMEGFGLAAVDAMLRGLPVLAAAHGGLLEAKLGTPGLLAVRPITQYASYLDEALLPAPVVPDQDIEPWAAALTRLLSDRDEHERQSAIGIDAASRFVSALTIDPLERWLERLAVGDLHVDHAVPAPADDGLSARVARLTRAQQAILLHRLVADSDQPSRSIGYDTSDFGRDAVLSWQQEGVWLAQQRDPTSTAYHLSMALDVTGAFSARTLGRALDIVATRHAILRTTYRVIDGSPRQHVATIARIVVDSVDMRAAGPAAAEDALAHLQARAAVPFQLDRDYPLRVSAVRIADDRWRLGFVLHHVCCDGWSVHLLARELANAYVIADAEAVDERPAPPCQYRDFAEWQRQQADAAAVLQDLDYWRTRLDGLEPLSLGTRTARGGPSPQAGIVRATVPEAVAQALRRVATATGCATAAAFLAATALTLRAWTGRGDLPIAVDVANRASGRWHDLVGLFANQSLVRVGVRGEQQIEVLIRSCAEVLRETLEHQHAPWERVVEVLPDALRRARHPYEVKLVHSSETPRFALQGLSVTPIAMPRALTKGDLTIFVEDRNGSADLQFEYHAGALAETEVVEFAALFGRVLNALASDGTQRVHAVVDHLVDRPERAAMVDR
jgi:glycosyltransferase involved in cell wall biosynthesis